MTKVLIVGDYRPSGDGVSIQMQYLHAWIGSAGSLQTEIFSTKSHRLLWPLVLIRLFLKARQFDVINSHACSYRGFRTAWMCHVVSRVLHKKLVLVFHGGSAQEFFDRFPARRRILKAHQPIVVPSGFLASVFAAYGIATEIIPNAVDLNRFSFQARQGLRPRIVTTRNLSAVYNIKSAIDALVLVQKQYPAAQLSIVGAGPLRQELEQGVREQAVEGVTFLGRISNDRVAHVLTEHDIFINTSLQDNLPVSVLEAFASGLPVVSTNVGGIPYLVTDKKTGLLVQPDDPEEMAAKILWILEHQREALAMALAARNSLHAYDARVLREKWREFLEPPAS